jgi:hypothetical protein
MGHITAHRFILGRVIIGIMAAGFTTLRAAIGTVTNGQSFLELAGHSGQLFFCIFEPVI